MSRVAIIDLGTNTFHLLIAEKNGPSRPIIYRERLPVKIGMGGINEGLITDAGTTRAVEAMKIFKRTLDEMDVQEVFAVGTSALRNAKNGKEIVAQIQFETGIPIRIISGDEEAEYICLGVRRAIALGNDPSLIVDIGGGSVEFILGNHREIFWKQSFEIGAQRLLEQFQRHDPILPQEINELNAYLTGALKSLAEPMQKFNPSILIGSSGTFDTLSEIYCIRHSIPYRSIDPETPLTLESFHQTFHELKIKTRAERLHIHGMIEMRVDMIVVACCLVEFILREYSFRAIRVSTYSLKEGVLAGLLA